MYITCILREKKEPFLELFHFRKSLINSGFKGYWKMSLAFLKCTPIN
nr:MAG TPA: FerI domain protein [Caudoviricetes sp.]